MEEKSLGRSFLILSLSGILVKLLSAAYVPLLNAAIGKDAVGVYSSSYNMFVFILAVTSMGAQPAVMKVVAELKALGRGEDAYRTMKLSRNYLTIIGIIATVLFIILSKPIASLVGLERSVLSMYFLAPTILFTCILAAYRGYLQGIEEMETLAISQVIEQFINVVLSLIFAALLIKVSVEWGSAGGTVGTTIGALVAIVFTSYMFEKKHLHNSVNEDENKIKRISDKKIIRKLIKYGLPIILVAIMQNAGILGDTLLVQSRLKAAGFSQTEASVKFALLNYYNTLLYVPLSIVTALSAAVFPKIINAYTNKNRKELKIQVAYTFKLTYLIVIPACFGLAVLSEQIYIMLFGSSQGYELLKYGSIVLLFMSITSIQNTIFQGANKLYLVLKTASIGVVIKIIIDYFLVYSKEINVFGAVVASFIGFLAPTILNHKKMKKLLRIRVPIIRQGIIPLIASSAMTVAIVVIKMPLMRVLNIVEGGRGVVTIMVLILISIGGLIYLIVSILFGGISKKDLDMISPRLFSLLPKFLRKNM